MREETAEWLNPMLDEWSRRNHADDGHPAGGDRGELVRQLMLAATMPAVEAGTPIMDWRAALPDGGNGARAMDWVRFGQLLRHELGWDDTYPAYPDFPEARNTP